MALDSNGLELLNRQPEAHVSVDNMLVLIHWVSNLLTLGLLKIIWAAVFAKFSLDVWADIDDSG